MLADEIKKLLNLEPHPIEGGFFRRTYTSPGSLDLERGKRAHGTAIYYLLEPGTFSEMHVLDSDEIFHFYPNSAENPVLQGGDVERGERSLPQLGVCCCSMYWRMTERGAPPQLPAK